jgi:hypothetical protein
MIKQDTLKPIDLVVAMALAIKRDVPPATYGQLGLTLGVSSSTTFEAVRRLQGTGLLRPGSRIPNIQELRNFLVHGVKHAFPARLGREMRGVPTAHAGPALKKLFDTTNPVVWPDAEGTVRGTSLTPLYPNATELPRRAPEIYDLLTLVDALRVGQARERKAALAAIDQAFEAGSE